MGIHFILHGCVLFRLESYCNNNNESPVLFAWGQICLYPVDKKDLFMHVCKGMHIIIISPVAENGHSMNRME